MKALPFRAHSQLPVSKYTNYIINFYRKLKITYKSICKFQKKSILNETYVLKNFLNIRI